MATSTEAQSAISSAFDTYIAQLAHAADVWEQKPAGAAEGEDAWCARQVAEHIAGSGLFFGSAIAQAVGVAGPELARIQLPEPANAVAETQRTHGLLMDVVNQVSDEQLAIEIDHPRLGKQTVSSMLDIVSGHLKDHGNQLKTLCGS